MKKYKITNSINAEITIDNKCSDFIKGSNNVFVQIPYQITWVALYTYVCVELRALLHMCELQVLLPGGQGSPPTYLRTNISSKW